MFLNLIVNAAQARGDGGSKPGEIRLRLHEAGAHVEVASEDNGVGIPPEVRARLFEPFFATKPSGVGTGPGLSISKQIVEAMGGEILADSVVDQGTRFKVRLPKW